MSYIYKRSFLKGQESENRFIVICENLGIEVTKSKKQQDIVLHIDLFLKRGEGEISVDYKSQKSKTRGGKKMENQTWIEIQNVQGKHGWLYGKADYIVFEQQDKYFFAKRSELVKFVEKKVDLSAEPTHNKTLYGLYTRKDRKDLLTIVYLDEFEDFLDKEPYKIYKPI